MRLHSCYFSPPEPDAFDERWSMSGSDHQHERREMWGVTFEAGFGVCFAEQMSKLAGRL